MNSNEQLDAEVLAACRLAAGEQANGAERLRHVCEAGRLLAAVKPQRGVRTSASGLTNLQACYAAVGISRQAGSVWIKAGRISNEKRTSIRITLPRT